MKTLFCALLFCVPALSWAQELDSIPHVQNEQFLLPSKTLQENRSIWVYTPPDYHQSTDSFPVLYLLDGGKHFSYVRELVAYLSDFEQPFISRMIVVAIPNVDRGRDLTPAKGADKFLAFLETELVPYINSHYRTHPYRILTGHSLAGLFAIYANTMAPGLFQASILISPALDSTNAGTQRLIERFGNGLNRDKAQGRRFVVTLGNEATGGVNMIKKQLGQYASPDRWAYLQYPADNHFSVPYKSMYDGLRWLYEGWFMDVFLNREKRSWHQIESHFDSLSERFGYKALPSEDFINSCGYEQLNAGNLSEAIGIFEANVRLHPHSWNAFDSLGEAYRKAGNLQKAIESYTRSIELNPANENGKQVLKKLRAN